MQGTIVVEGLEVFCIIGVHPHERVRPQRLILRCELDRDFEAAARTDDVSQTLDYVAVAQTLTTMARKGKYQLLETYVEEAAEALLSLEGVTRVGLEVQKPAAIERASWAGVKIERFAEGRRSE